MNINKMLVCGEVEPTDESQHYEIRDKRTPGFQVPSRGSAVSERERELGK